MRNRPEIFLQMKPTEFKARFIKALPVIPPDIDLDLAQFQTFPPKLVNDLNIPTSDKAILIEVGLPESAAPFLDFCLKEDLVLQPLNQLDTSLEDEFKDFLLIGSNGSGDSICINKSFGEIVYFNHDNDMQKIFMNSSVTKLAETLCLFAESMAAGYNTDFINDLARVDIQAIREPAMWPFEFKMSKEALEE